MKNIRVLNVICICILLFICGCSNTSKQEDDEYIYSYGGLHLIKADGWEIQDMSDKDGSFLYYSDNGVINIYFRQIEGMDEEELADYMRNVMPDYMEEGIKNQGYENITIVPSKVMINDNYFPACFATYEYGEEAIEECVFAQLVGDEIMMVDISAFRESTAPELLEMFYYYENRQY